MRLDSPSMLIFGEEKVGRAFEVLAGAYIVLRVVEKALGPIGRLHIFCLSFGLALVFCPLSGIPHFVGASGEKLQLQTRYHHHEIPPRSFEIVVRNQIYIFQL